MDIRSTGQRIMRNKREKGFNTTDIPLELCFIQGEITEFFQAWRKGEANLGEELADIAIYLFGLAEITGVDLEKEIERKLERNDRRQYANINGVVTRVSEWPNDGQ